MKVVRSPVGLAMLPILVAIVCIAGALTAQDRAADRVAGSGPAKGFVYLATRDPSIQIDMRYAGRENFTGAPVRGYETGRCIVSVKAADGLIAVQNDLRNFGYGLKVFDAYRPQRAVNAFVRWTKSPGDNAALKARYYPDVAKSKLIEQGYIAGRSGHSRGSCVDVTLVRLPGVGDPAGKGPQELDMGTPFDYFGSKSHSESKAISSTQRLHRLLLRSLMEKHGFEHLREEWWHFSLEDEPFPDTYFDFPVR